MEENIWSKFRKTIDRNFALKLVDKMVEWDNYIANQKRRGREVNDQELRILYDIYDYFFYMVLKCESEDIVNINSLLMELHRRVSEKHRSQFYEGFFQALGQILMLRKLSLDIGEELWFTQWNQNFSNSLSKLGIAV